MSAASQREQHFSQPPRLSLGHTLCGFTLSGVRAVHAQQIAELLPEGVVWPGDIIEAKPWTCPGLGVKHRVCFQGQGVAFGPCPFMRRPGRPIRPTAFG